MGGAEDFAAGGHQGPDQQVQNLVGAVAQDELRWGEPQLGGQILFQVIGVAVGVAVQAGKIGLMAARALGEGPKGFSLEASLMASVRPNSRLKFFQGFAGLVGRQLREVRQNVG